MSFTKFSRKPTQNLFIQHIKIASGFALFGHSFPLATIQEHFVRILFWEFPHINTFPQSHFFTLSMPLPTSWSATAASRANVERRGAFWVVVIGAGGVIERTNVGKSVMRPA
jgi:hypothetical protein